MDGERMAMKPATAPPRYYRRLRGAGGRGALAWALAWDPQLWAVATALRARRETPSVAQTFLSELVTTIVGPLNAGATSSAGCGGELPASREEFRPPIPPTIHSEMQANSARRRFVGASASLAASDPTGGIARLLARLPWNAAIEAKPRPHAPVAKVNRLTVHQRAATDDALYAHGFAFFYRLAGHAPVPERPMQPNILDVTITALAHNFD